ncbi:MAG: NifU N-terminal domain-containing protein [Pyrinomonadaceae bacterium]
MPKIADIQETPNPNAVKFILKEPVSHGTSHSFKDPAAGAADPIAKSIFDVGNVVSVFYMDKMITVEKTDDAEWDEILPDLAVPIRAADAVQTTNGNGKKAAAASVG